ncbi:zinc finger protein hangover [Drosophila grimshawi]|uniref:GH12478 n=1 Tax=Drosophila grimshawi TaxID=7222 RepID=B4JJF6_DROGR|nr:zinc finger protein hangover [Drosophila grimshawi]EDV99708.1 GH12478 [Drosophila grimshawi]
MSKLGALFVLSCLVGLALALPESRLQQQRQVHQQQQQKLQHPYLFFSVPRGRANAGGGAVMQGFEIVEDPEDMHNDSDDDDAYDDDMPEMPLRRLQRHDDDELSDDDVDDDNDDDQPAQRKGLGFARNGQLVLLNGSNQDVDIDDDEEQDDDEQDDDVDGQLPMVLAKAAVMGNRHKPNAINGKQLLKNAKPTQMMVARDQAGAIMVPDGIIEIEGQSVVDEKTGKAALLVPRAALDAIPNGAVVALMERSSSSTGENEAGEERANRVIVRRRKTGGRRNLQLRRRAGRPVRRRRGGRPVRRRVNNRRRNVRVIRPNVNRRRGGAQRRRGQVMLRG